MRYFWIVAGVLGCLGGCGKGAGTSEAPPASPPDRPSQESSGGLAEAPGDLQDAPIRTVIVAQETLELPLKGVRGTQCIASEAIVYSCRYGANVVSVCSTPTTITYRYGPLNRPEIQIASNGMDGRSFSKVGGPKWVRLTNLRFSNAGYDYVIAGMEKTDQRTSWLAVYQGADRRLSERECPQHGELQSLQIPGQPSIPDESDPDFYGW